MLKSLLLCFMIFVSLGIFLIGSQSVLASELSPKEGNQLTPVAKETYQKPRASEDVKKIVEEAKKDDKDKPDKKSECVTGMKALSRPLSVPCQPF
ncbi:MAG: hypothetical protein ABIU05_06890 [Nitrospirales bacterium]